MKVIFIPELGDDVSEYDHLRNRVVEFDMPEEVANRMSFASSVCPCYFRINEHLQYRTSVVMTCVHCKEELRHVYFNGLGHAGLACNCGSWLGECNHFSGGFYGGAVLYRPWTKEEILNRIAAEKKKVDDKYADFLQGKD